MTNGTMAEALTPLRTRMPHVIREQEILRVVATLAGESDTKPIALAQREILAWAQRRSGGQLPREAWDGASFEYLAGGRTTLAVRLLSGSADIWALRADDPDKLVAGRAWTTEVTIGQGGYGASLLSVRQLASTGEAQLDIEPHAPGFLQQLVERCGLQVGGTTLRLGTWWIGSETEVGDLVSFMEDPTRRLPLIVASGDERSESPDRPLINAESLARATIGLAHVVVLPAALTYALSDAFGRMRSVYHGGARIYLPKFDADANPYEHRLFFAETLRTSEGAENSIRVMRQFAARESLLRWRLNVDVLTFGSVRTAALRVEREQQVSEGASDVDRLNAAQKQIRALDDELLKAKSWEGQLTQLHDEAEARALAAEAQLRGSVGRIQQLETYLRQQDQIPDAESSLPDLWSDFGDWCDEHLIGRVILSPSARRGVKSPEFEDVPLAARCLVWLANECRDRRIDGGGSLSEFVIESGVRNSSCGSDSYELDFQGQRLGVDWHIKNGGNTRDPTRCLRIYYGWDALSQQIVIADMPAHRRTGAS